MRTKLGYLRYFATFEKFSQYIKANYNKNYMTLHRLLDNEYCFLNFNRKPTLAAGNFLPHTSFLCVLKLVTFSVIAASKREKRLFQKKWRYSYEIPKLCHCLFQNNNR